MSLFNNNLNEILMNKAWNDNNFILQNDRLINDIANSKYTNAQNIYIDAKGRLLEKHNIHKKGKLPQFYYDEVFLRPIDQPYLKDEYGNPLEAGRDMSLFNTISKQPVIVSSYIVNPKSIKRYASAVSTRQKISNAFDFETLQRVEPKDFDYKLLRSINLKNA